jgi:hypothetical protein
MSDLIHLPVTYNSMLHPDVLYVPEGWNGFEYWMACTPYPEAVEDPHIFASHDGLTWVVPAGLVNPIDLHTYDTYNSDPDLTLHDNVLYCVWRNAVPGKFEVMYASESVDGVHWSPRQKLFVSAWRQALSPAVVFHDNLFHMYTVNVDGAVPLVTMRTAGDMMGPWVMYGRTDMPVTGASDWHVDVVHDNLGWFCLMTANVPGTSELFYGESVDGLRWRMRDKPLIDGGNIYRASGVRLDNKLAIWYSVYDNTRVVNTMYHTYVAV